MEKKKNPLTFAQLVKVFICACGFAALANLAYFPSSYYTLFQDAFGYTDIQVGTLAGFVGTTAFFSYLFSGILADLLPTKVCLLFSYLSSIFLGMWMYTQPEYGIMKFICLALGICAILTFFAPMIKFLRSLGSPDQEGRLLGMFYGCIGAISLTVGTIGSAVTGANTPIVGLKTMILINVGILIFCGIGHCIIDKKRKDAKTNTFSFKQCGKVFTNVNMWLVAIIGITSYSASTVVCSYVQPLLSRFFLVATATITLIATVRNYGAKLVVAPLAGKMIDLLGSAARVVMLSFFVGIAASITLMFVPWVPQNTWVCVIVLVALGCIVALCQPGRNALVSETGVPLEAKGTATGLMACAIMLPDAVVYPLYSGFLTKYEGAKGYNLIFTISIVLCLIGLAATLVLNKRIKNAKLKVSAEA